MNILARLEDMHSKRYNSNWAAWVQTQCSEAAKEIRTLRKRLAGELEAYRLSDRIATERMQKAEAEAARLRHVMEDCVAGHDDCCNYVCNKIKEALAEAVSPWRREPPDEQDLWWWWNEDGPPVVVSIMASGHGDNGRYFASQGQHGWNRAQWVEDMGGYWMRCSEPPLPAEAVRG